MERAGDGLGATVTHFTRQTCGVKVRTGYFIQIYASRNHIRCGFLLIRESQLGEYDVS